MKSIYWIPRTGPGRLGIILRPRGGDWLYNDLRDAREERVDIILSALTDWEIEDLGLTDEEDCCTRQLMRFWRFPIPDRSVPTMESALLIIERITNELRLGKSIVVHCRMGIGRSGILSAGVLVHEGMSPSKAIALVSETREIPVPDTDEQKQWLVRFAQQLKGDLNE